MNKLEREVATHHAGVDELNREHQMSMDTLREEKTMLDVGGVHGCGQFCLYNY